jgi:hypothetical protein
MAARKRVIDGKLLEIAEREMPCICDSAYAERGLVDPHCRCDDRDDLVAAVVSAS